MKKKKKKMKGKGSTGLDELNSFDKFDVRAESRRCRRGRTGAARCGAGVQRRVTEGSRFGERPQAAPRPAEDSFEVVAAEPEEDEEEEESGCAEPDLNLARVQLGSRMGLAAADDVVSNGAKRAAGVAVRLTRMGYGVAKDGAMTAPRVKRFIKQMSFQRRARALAHGSLVTGKGSWSAQGDAAPITLPPMPDTIEELSQMFMQFPTKDVQKFATGGPSAAIKVAPGHELCIPGLFTVKNVGGIMMVSRPAPAASG